MTTPPTSKLASFINNLVGGVALPFTMTGVYADSDPAGDYVSRRGNFSMPTKGAQGVLTSLNESSGKDVSDFLSTKVNKTSSLAEYIRKAAFFVPDMGALSTVYEGLAGGEIPSNPKEFERLFGLSAFDTDAVRDIKKTIIGSAAKKLETQPTLARTMKSFLPGLGIAGLLYAGTKLSDYMTQAATHSVGERVIDRLRVAGHDEHSAAKAFGVMAQFSPDLAKNEEVAYQHLNQALKYDGVANPADIKNMIDVQKNITQGRAGLSQFISDIARGAALA